MPASRDSHREWNRRTSYWRAYLQDKPKPKQAQTPRFPFGQYRGRPFPSVPSDYLRRCLGLDIDDKLRERIEGELMRRHGGTARRPASPLMPRPAEGKRPGVVKPPWED